MASSRCSAAMSLTHVDEPLRRARSRSLCRPPSIAALLVSVPARAAALPPPLRRRRARPGAADHGPHLHVASPSRHISGDRLPSHCSRRRPERPDRSGLPRIPRLPHFLIVCGAVLVTVLWLGLERTRFGAQIRAAVDNLRMAQSVGINTSRLFTAAFALGSGLAALGGALGAEILAIEPGLCARASRLFSHRRRGRRIGQHSRAVRRRVAARHRRYGLQISACPSSAPSSSMR